MAQIKFIRSACGFGYGYLEGAVLDCSEGFAEEMVELGVAVKLDKRRAALPPDFPSRHILVKHGIETIDELKKYNTVEMLCELKGIAKRSAELILERIKEKA